MQKFNKLFSTDHKLIVEKINEINPVKYEKTRNFLNGDITYLSPYISRGVISTKQIMDIVLKNGFSLFQSEKLIQELAWREYYQRVWQISAGYILFGPSSMLVYTTGNGVNGFTYEPSLGEFVLSNINMTSNKNGNIYSMNEGFSYDIIDKRIIRYIDYCKKSNYTARYIGSLVADFHRNLLKGGVYIYPSINKYPNGKLRLMFEANALAFIIEQAGGKARNGEIDILDINPTSIHQTTPLYIGSANMVDRIEKS